NWNTVHPYELGFMSNRDRLLSSGLLVMLYATHRTEPTDAEYQLLRQYIANGGRVLLLCPAWVWKSYDKKPLDRLPYARIAECFGLKMIFDSAKGTLSIVHPEYKVQGSEGLLEGTFSITDYRRDGTAFPIAEDSAGNAVCVAAIREDARIIVWGQNNLLSRKLEAKRAAADFLGKAIDWLFAGRPGDGRRDVSITQPPHTEQPK
ncbi:MAG: hypothetical protein O3C69_04145, partial [Chloroflexi bacterium]|nr:hypothetical protein [Chloroflexota bacterium]